MVEWCTKQGYTEAPLPASRSRASVALFRGATPPRNPLWPPLDPPLRDGLRGGFLDLENGAIWPLNGLRAKKIPRFQDQGAGYSIHGAVE